MYGCFAANFVLLPFNLFISTSGDVSRNPLADNSLLLLLIFVHYRKCVMVAEPIADKSDDAVNLDSLSRENSYFSDNPYCKALENARDVECKLAVCSFSFITELGFCKLLKLISLCSWSCRYWGKCTQWTTREIILCFSVWHSWTVSIYYTWFTSKATFSTAY